MELYNNLPLYLLDVGENNEVDFVALVDKPAIKKDFMMFNHKERFAINEERKIISGPLMLADTPIYRRDEKGEYYVMFKADAIEKIVLKFFDKKYQHNVNLMHDSGSVVEGVTMFESYIYDRGNKPMAGFEDVPEGSWFGSFKVENDEVWQQVKDGKVKGFSVEGGFTIKPKEEEFADAIIALIESHGF